MKGSVIKWGVCGVWGGWGMRGLLAAVTMGTVTLAAPAWAARVEYSVTIQGSRGGAMTVDTDADSGQVQVDFSYRDNGRGPDLNEAFRVDAAQRVVAYRVTGQSTYGGAIGEDFSFADGRIRWVSPADKGDEAAADGSLFVPLESSPAVTAQLLRALLARPELKAPAVGGATLAAERLAAMLADGPAGPVPVALYAITGGDSTPWYLWLRDDASQALFALVYPGWFLTPTGFEATAERLLQRQRQAQDERLRSIRQRSAQPLPGLTLVKNVRWFDSRAAAMRGPADVYLNDGRIGLITAPGVLQATPLQTIDGTGRTLLPGLFDMHAHISDDEALLHLAGGVTTVRDMGGHNDAVWRLKGRIEGGEVAGPHIVPAGFIEGQSPFSARLGIVAADLEAGLKAVDWYAARGYHQIKLYNSIKPEWVKPLAARAHQHGMRVAGHVPAFMRAEEAVRAGYDELTHINQVMLNFFVTPQQDTRTLLRFTLVGDEARRVALQGKAARDFIALLRKQGTTVDPTLATFEAMFVQRDGERHPWLTDIADHLPVLWRRGLLKSEMSPTPEQAARYRPSYARMVEFVGALYRGGVPLVAGTDSIAGLSLHRELELYVKAGIPPLQVLKIATFNGARTAGVGGSTGAIERGLAADLILVEGDPEHQIGDVRKASLVIQGGVAYAPAQLYEALGMRGFAAPVPVQREAAASKP